jgi:hypothetical protein
MPIRALAAIIVLCCAFVGRAHADESAQSYQQLQEMLEQKFAPPAKRSIAPSAPPATEKEDFQWIRPKTDGARRPTPGARSSTSSWYSSITSYFFPEAEEEDASKPVQAGVLRSKYKEFRQRRRDRRAASPMQNSAQPEVPVAKKNSFTIQLKPTTDES